MINRIYIIVCFFTLYTTSMLHATHGYFSNGIGVKSVGMGGVATALPQDSLISATNPAGISKIGRQLDIGAKAFIPLRRYSYTGSQTIPADTIASQNNIFAIPGMGINYPLNDLDTIGCTIFGYGGNNVSYLRNNPVFGARDQLNTPPNFPLNSGSLGANFLQVVVTPSYAHTFCYAQSLGIAPLIGIQAFKVKGLYRVANTTFSSNPCLVTNKDHDVVPGIGVQFGWLGTFWDMLQVGASYATKIYTRRLKHYAGLLAEQGKFNIPAVLNVGIAWTNYSEKFMIAFDYQRIFYSGVPSISHSIAKFGIPIDPSAIQNQLGTDDGPGFGWQTINIFKCGASYQLLPKFIVRGGFSHGDIPYNPKTEIDFNIIAPAVIKDHITIGTTLIIDTAHEIDLAYVYAFQNKVSGQSAVGLGTVSHQMRQHSVDLALVFKF
jgi:long-chain fatty acid transport protein